MASGQQQLDAAGVEYQAYETKSPGDATIQTRAALKSGIEAVVVVGGDGTLSEAAGRVLLSSTTISTSSQLRSILPQRLRLFRPVQVTTARGLTGSRAPLEKWVDTVIAHTPPRQIDVLYGYEKPFICLNASTMGIGGETAGRVAAQGKFMRNFSGEFRFVFAAVGALAVWRSDACASVLMDELWSMDR